MYEFFLGAAWALTKFILDLMPSDSKNYNDTFFDGAGSFGDGFFESAKQGCVI